MNVRVLEDSVLLEIHVTNVTSSPISLEFTSTQRYDFEIANADGESIWRWSAARSFGQALGEEALQPGDSRRYTATWDGNGDDISTWDGSEREGDFIATGWVVSVNYPVELRTGFQLPAD